MSKAPDKQFLSTYTRHWYHQLFYLTASGFVEHRRDTLTLQNYFRLADLSLTWSSQGKHTPRHYGGPTASRSELAIPSDIPNMGISISAGNKSKMLSPSVWGEIFMLLASWPCLYYVFWQANKQGYFDALVRYASVGIDIGSLIGLLPLEEVPDKIRRMDCYIFTDLDNVYIADTMQVPVICFAGPCAAKEQRPLNNALIIFPKSIRGPSLSLWHAVSFCHSSGAETVHLNLGRASYAHFCCTEVWRGWRILLIDFVQDVNNKEIIRHGQVYLTGLA